MCMTFDDLCSFELVAMLSLSSLATTTVVSTHPETMIISLEADDIGYGMGLQGGATERGVYPIIIASIEAGGPAAKYDL